MQARATGFPRGARTSMRLICGLLRLDGTAVDESLLRAMVAQMDVPRLRPQVTLWREGVVGLAVIDFAARGASELPQQGAGVMAADVRLDEPDVLARLLGRNSACPQADLLLATVQRFGAPGLERVLGDFAFARWDRQSKRLLCGCDIFGIRPLSYVHRPGRLFAFASLPKALHGTGIVAKKIDESAVARRIARSLRNDDSTIAGIKRLPPAHVIEVSRDGIQLTRYWRLDRSIAGTRQCSPEEAAREMRRLVTEAVRCRLPREGEIGAQLSGGLDSPAIAVLAARQLREKGRTLHAYSFLDRQRNDIALEDESESIKAVLDQEGYIDWTPFRLPYLSHPGSIIFDCDNMQPLDPNRPVPAACARAEAQGVGIILSGWGGDEGATFNARGALAELFLCGRWRLLAREISALGRERGWPRWRILRGEVLSYLWGDWLPPTIRGLTNRITGKAPRLRNLRRRPLSPALRRALAASSDQGLRMVADGRENRWRLLSSPHITERAEIDAQVGARHGLAFAFPLLDRRVVEFVLSLPSELFFRDGVRRSLFRDAMTDVLPAKIRLRHNKLSPFPSRLMDYLEGRDELLEKIDSYEKSKAVRRVIDLAWLRRQVQAFPSPEQVYEELRAGTVPVAAPMIAAAVHGFSAAAYIEQHGSE